MSDPLSCTTERDVEGHVRACALPNGHFGPHHGDGWRWNQTAAPCEVQGCVCRTQVQPL